jgi:hypothetical protein
LDDKLGTKDRKATMIVAGIDVGGKNVHIVIKKDGQLLGKITGPTGIKKAEAVEQLYDQVLKQAGLIRKDVDWVEPQERLKSGFANSVVRYHRGCQGNHQTDSLSKDDDRRWSRRRPFYESRP